VAALAGLILTGCNVPSFGAYRGATKEGQDAFKLWQGFFIAGLVVFIFVFLLILWAVIRYRRRSDAVPRQSQYHTVVEILYTVLPIVTVLILFGFTFATENEVDALPKPATVIDVYGFQWGWQFNYPAARTVSTSTDANPAHTLTVIGAAELTKGKVASYPSPNAPPIMLMPSGASVRIYLRSKDVIHGFYIPEFNFSRYAQPGYANQFTFNVPLSETGSTFRAQCTQLCGLYHSEMLFNVKVVSMSHYKWCLHSQGRLGSFACAGLPSNKGSGGLHA
jgi:cytochrome c oxidase subunit 2